MWSAARHDRAMIVSVGFLSALEANGAPFASNADKNPTLTIMALSWRAADHIVDEAKKGNL